jgi:hypothetical protein
MHRLAAMAGWILKALVIVVLLGVAFAAVQAALLVLTRVADLGIPAAYTSVASLAVVALLAWWGLRPRLGATLAWMGFFVLLCLAAGVVVPLLPSAGAEIDLLAFAALPILVQLTVMSVYYTWPVAPAAIPEWAAAAEQPRRKLFGRWTIPVRAAQADQRQTAPSGAPGGIAGAIAFLVICIVAGVAVAVVGTTTGRGAHRCRHGHAIACAGCPAQPHAGVAPHLRGRHRR